MKYPKAVIKKAVKDKGMIEIDEKRMIGVKDGVIYRDGCKIIETRHSGEFVDKAFYLKAEWDWIIAHDGTCPILIPLKKEDC
jgi:hypothetical protein